MKCLSGGKCNCGKDVRVLMVLSFATLILAVAVSVFAIDLWLAGTQWILVSILLAVYANHLQHCHGSSCDAGEDSEQEKVE